LALREAVNVANMEVTGTNFREFEPVTY